jgi:hypothetical protein
MRQTCTFLFLLFAFVTYAQSGHQTIRKSVFIEGTFNVQNTYYRTAIDWNGVKSIAEGTIKEVVSASGTVIDEVEDLWGNVFGNNEQEEQSVYRNDDGELVYEDKEGRVFTEKRVTEPRIMPRVGFEFQISPESRMVEADVAVSNGKYDAISIAFRGVGKAFPAGVVGKIMGKDPNFLNTLYVGMEMGYDSSFPGFILTTKKTYVGLNMGMSVPVFTNGSVNLGAMVQTSDAGGKIKQHNLFASFKIPLSVFQK